MRQSALAGFSALSIGVAPWVYSLGAVRDAEHAVHAIQKEKEFSPGALATNEERYHVASMRIMQSLCRAIDTNGKEQPIIWDEIDGVGDLYSQSASFIETINFDFEVYPRIAMIGSVAQSCLENAPARTPQIQFAKEVWHARGNVIENQTTLSSVAKTLKEDKHPEQRIESISVGEAGEIATVSSFPEMRGTPVEIPFYRQYISPTRASYEYLQAYFEDILSLNEKITSL